MRKTINTVTGPITADQLGRTFSHEHFFFGYPGYAEDVSSGKHPTKEQVIDTGVKAAKLLLSQGFNTVVDGTANDCARNFEWLKEISEKSGIQIIGSTGYYVPGICGAGYWNFRARQGIDVVGEIAELMTNELTKGYADTGILAGAIKIGVEHEFSDYVKRLFAAAPKAQKNTDAVIFAHTENGALSVEAATLLMENGVNPSRTMMGHMDGTLDSSVHKKILDMGFYISFDRIGAYYYSPTDEQRIGLVKEIIDLGYEDRILMSQDAIAQYLGRPFKWPDDETEIWRNYRMGYIGESFLSLMLEMGITQAQIDKFFIENPKQLFFG